MGEEIDRTREVFVVHGRNYQARDAMFQFLESLQLRPLTWQAAAQRTSEATPSTLDSVLAGLKHVQAVVVLMTGDDLARLRPEFGREIATTQPRPNVLIEAGMALALFGKERVVFVKHHASRELSDFSGLNYVEIDNTPGSRQALARRLRSAGCTLEVLGDRHLSPSTGGDFDDALSIEDEPPFLERGGFDQYIVDSSISYRKSNVRLLEELTQQIKNPGASDLKFNYLGVAGASNWLALTRDTAYVATDLRDLMSDAIPKFLQNRELKDQNIDLISLGPGDGELDAQILREARTTCRIRNYYPIDISIELLQQTVERNMQMCKAARIRIKAILGDFLELRRYKPIYGYDDAANLITLVGFTFGNYSEATLLRALADALNPGDLVILDARLHDIGSDLTYPKLQSRAAELLPRFRHGANNRFAFGPVEMATIAEFSQAKIEQELSKRTTVVEDAFNVVTYCKDLDTRLRGGGRIVHKRLDLAATTFYHLEKLQEFIEDRDFTVVDTHRKGHTAALLLRRR